MSTYAIFVRNILGIEILDNVFSAETLEKAQKAARYRLENLSKWEKRNFSKVNTVQLRKANSVEQIAEWVGIYEARGKKASLVKKNNIGGYIV